MLLFIKNLQNKKEDINVRNFYEKKSRFISQIFYNNHLLENHS